MEIRVIGSMQYTEKMMEARDEMPYCQSEIEAVKPIIINEDLSLIK